MLNEKQNAVLNSAKKYFDEGDYNKMLPLLNSLVAQKVNSPDLFHMLGTMYYEQGQFKSSINSFKKALEIDPDFTDSSVGLSVVLNDLGKYEQAGQVFQAAQERLKKTNSTDRSLSLRQALAEKHMELSKLYSQHKDPQQAFEHILKYEEHLEETEDSLLKKVQILRSLNNFKFASQILKSWMHKSQSSISLDIYANLVEIYYMDKQPLAALSVCEEGLRNFPESKDLKNLLKNLKTTTFDLQQMEMTI